MSRSDRVGAPVPERGQSTVEFALVLPLVALSLLMIVQVALLATTKVATVHTARDVARAIAIDPDAHVDQWASTQNASNPSGVLISVELVSPADGAPLVCVTVIDQDPAAFPLFASVLDRIEVGSTAKMLMERDS